MISSIVDAFKDLVLNFSWKRIIHILVLISIVFIVLMLVEWQTCFFKLSKIERISGLMKEIESIDSCRGGGIADLRDVCFQIIEQLKEKVKPRPVNFFLGTSPKKFLFGLLPWLIFCLFFIPSILRREINSLYGAFGALVVGSLVSLAYTLIPLRYSWINYFAIPWAGFILIVCLILNYQNKKQKKIEK